MDEEITVPPDQPDPPYLDSPLVEDEPTGPIEEPVDEPEPMTAGEYLDPEAERRP